ncbi:hypothetical protein GCM10010435_95510 [Winogradskya consettensis]|uniref:Uncharacterized protein n=1 Tax=Winogradskya consettensis TaxID=113560 RepID=A0A919W1W5_9ACTN|nr:hypothetical protein Aco04nite_90960 [Actinoplanes consettensis]
MAVVVAAGVLLPACVPGSSVAMAIALVEAGFGASGPAPGLALGVIRARVLASVFAAAMTTTAVGARGGTAGPASGLALVMVRVLA